jgi:hypothetical protein
MMRAMSPGARRRPRGLTQSWTDDELVAELRAWTQATGHRSSSRYERDRGGRPDLPPLSTICKRFGGWHAALAEIGETSPRPSVRRYSDADLVAALRSWLHDGGDGKAATYHRDAARLGLPSFNTVYLRLGPWRTALARAAQPELAPGLELGS